MISFSIVASAKATYKNALNKIDDRIAFKSFITLPGSGLQAITKK